MQTKLSVIGAGNVGATTAELIARDGLADIVLFDIHEGIAKGKALDITEACPVWSSPSIVIGTSNFEETAGSDVIIITAGFPRKPGMSRDDLLIANADVIKAVTEGTVKYSPDSINVVVTNPMDVMAYAAFCALGLCDPHSRWTGAVAMKPVVLAAVLTLSLLIGAQGGAAEAPNILLIYIDNVGYGDLGCYGNSLVRTPRMDRLAKEGVRSSDFYVVTSSCTPSRGALLTGRYPARNGLQHQLVTTENWDGIGLPHRERILPEYLRDAGYATACFGKWNIGFAPGSRPTERGFDEFFGFRSGNIHYFAHTYHGEYDMFL